MNRKRHQNATVTPDPVLLEMSPQSEETTTPKEPEIGLVAETFSSDQVRILKKIHALMAVVPYIERKRRVMIKGQLAYKYASEEDILKAIRHLFVEKGLLTLPRRCRSLERFQVAQGGYVVLIQMEWEIIDVETGANITVVMPGAGHDIFEKAIYKALTGSYKYMFAKSLMIVTGDDPEKDDLGATEKHKADVNREISQATDMPGTTKVEHTGAPPQYTDEDYDPWDLENNRSRNFDPEDLRDADPDWWRTESYKACVELETIYPGGLVGTMHLKHLLSLIENFVPAVDGNRHGFIGSACRRLASACRARLAEEIRLGRILEKREKLRDGTQKISYFLPDAPIASSGSKA